MRILFLTPAYPPFPGGGERYVRSLAKQLTRQGHEITVVTSTARRERDLWESRFADEVVEADDAGVALYRCPLRPLPGKWIGLLALRKSMVLLSAMPGDRSAVLLKLARHVPPIGQLEPTLARIPGHFDVIHGFNISWEYPMAAGFDHAQRQGVPFAATPFAHFGTGKSDRVALNSTMDHQRRIMSTANAVLTLTSIESENLRRHGVVPQQMKVIGGGMDPIPDTIGAELVAEEHGLTAPYILFIGRANRDKGAIHAAEAIRRLRSQGSQVTLALIGQATAEFSSYYRKLAQNEQQFIRPLGILSDAEKHALLEHSVMLLLPSRSDSFGIVILEAWSHGKPVIGANAGGIPGVIDHGENGLLVDFGDVGGLAESISEFLGDKDKARSMGLQGRAKVSGEYTWEKVADRVIAVYQQLLAGHK